jgi:hypothetical protein
MDVYRLASITTSTRAQHSGADVVKQAAAPAISSLLYPVSFFLSCPIPSTVYKLITPCHQLLQALDEEYLGG